MEVSPSTVTALNVSWTPSASSAWSTAGVRFASVATKPSMVAMSGAIMPEPLAIPAIRTRVPPISASATAPLGKVSVVMMARAACSHLPGSRLSVSACSRSSTLP